MLTAICVLFEGKRGEVERQAMPTQDKLYKAMLVLVQSGKEYVQQHNMLG